MLDLKALLSKILDALKVDYIIEEGTSGIWTYRKWASGIAECWCITTPTSIPASTWAAWGSVYEAKITDVINYPTNLFTSFPTLIASATPRSTAGVMGIETSATGNASHTPYFYALRPNKPTATMTISASIHAIGTWGGVIESIKRFFTFLGSPKDWGWAMC